MYGKIILAEEADHLFGPVIEVQSISADELLNIIQQTNRGVLFNIINGELIILGDGRKVLFPLGKKIANDVIFHHASKELVLEIITGSEQKLINVELRKEVCSVSNGKSTLEWMEDCPPNCP